MQHKYRPPISLILLLAGAAPITAHADLIYNNGQPGGPLGYWGADVCPSQTVGVRFTPPNDVTLDQVGLWLMNNDWSGETHPLVRVTVQTDENDHESSTPSGLILDELFVTVTTVGWLPVLESAVSQENPRLCGGTHYWIVAESQATCGFSGVWVMSGENTGFSANTFQGQWQSGGEGAVPGLQVHAAPIIVGDIDGTGECNLDDVIPFAAALVDLPQSPFHTARSDLNCDGQTDGLDVQPFVAALLGS